MNQPKIKIAAYLNGTTWGNGHPHQRHIVYDTDGIAPTICGMDKMKNPVNIIERI